MGRHDHPPDAVISEPDAPATDTRPSVRLAVILSLIAAVAVGGLTGWLSNRAYHTYQAEQQRELFLEVGRQAALNLTTIEVNQVDANVSQILNSATGTFLDDFQKRSQAFIDVVKQAQSKSVGTITEAGVEAVEGDRAQLLVAVQVKTTMAGGHEQEPRAWRMRIDVQKVGDQVKVANVQYLSNTGIGIRARNTAWAYGPSQQRVEHWGSRIERSHACDGA